MLGLGLSLFQVAVRGGGRVQAAAIIISKNNQDENTAIGTTIGNVSVIGGTGTYTFTKTADPDSAFTLAAGTGFATWDTASVTNVTLSGVNLIATNTGTTSLDQGARVASTFGQTSGKYYHEITATTLTGGISIGAGICTTASTYTGMGNNATAGVENYFLGTGAIYANGIAQGGASLGVRSSGDKIGIATDLDNRRIWFRVAPSGNWNNSGTANPATNTGGITIPAGTMVPLVTFGGGSGTANNALTANFGATAFTGAVPFGFTSGWPGASGPPALKNAIVFDYETATGHNVTIHADNGAGSVLNRTFNIGVNDIDEVPPVITVSPSQTIPEYSPFSLVLTADKGVTWSKTGGADTALFTLTGNTLSLGAHDFEAPADADANNSYVVQVTATSTAYTPATTNMTITVTVTDIAAPTITSSATFSTPENAIWSTTLTASESCTFAITGGADSAIFSLAGAVLSLPTLNYEAPADADGNNTYVVNVRATSVATGEASADQTITVTITDVFEAPSIDNLLLFDGTSKLLIFNGTDHLLLASSTTTGMSLDDGSGHILTTDDDVTELSAL